MADDIPIAALRPELAEREMLFRALLDAPAVMAGVFELLDGDYRYVTANSNAAAFHGRGDIAGMTGAELGLEREHIEERVRVIQACLDSGGSQTHEYSFRAGCGRQGWFLGTFSPLPPTPHGSRRVSFVVIDSTERRLAQLDAERQRERLSLALEATGLGLWEYDIPGDRVSWDARMRALYDVPADAVVDFATYRAAVHPDDFADTQAAYAEALRGVDGGAYVVRHRTAGSGEEMRWVQGAGKVFFNAAGEPERVIGTSQDITREVRAQQQQALMQAELNHRVKNNLAAVQAIASQTLRTAGDDPQAFRKAFEGRLQSMARGHDLLSRNAWRTAGLAEVVAAALAPFARSAIRISAGQTPVRVRPDLAVNLVMVLNELATNAVKYGALSVPAGAVDIAWEMDGEGLMLSWRETGGPRVATPREPGFGSRMTRSALKTFGGRASLEFRPEGVECVLWAPRSDDLFTPT